MKNSPVRRKIPNKNTKFMCFYKCILCKVFRQFQLFLLSFNMLRKYTCGLFFLISKTLRFSQVNNFSRLFTGRPGFCYLPRLTGNCRGRFLSYFYDGVSRRCRAFFYSGCQGNENRFQNLQECQRICGNGGAGL